MVFMLCHLNIYIKNDMSPLLIRITLFETGFTILFKQDMVLLDGERATTISRALSDRHCEQVG